MKVYYKILDSLSTRRSWSSSVINEWSVHYKKGEWVGANAKGTPLFVFEDYDIAQSYSKASNIVRCHIKPWRGKNYDCRMRGHILRIVLCNSYEWRRYMHNYGYWPIPKGTILASKVFCID